MKRTTHSPFGIDGATPRWRFPAAGRLLPFQWGIAGLLVFCCAASVQAFPRAGGRSPGVHGVARLSATEERDLLFVFEQEKLIRDIHWVLEEKFGEQVFCKVPKSEQLHLRSVRDLCKAHGVGLSVMETGKFHDPRLKRLFDTLVDFGSGSPSNALLAGALAEEAGIQALENVSRRASQGDVCAIYENLRCGSMRRLKAFVSSYESLSGKSYSDRGLPRFGISTVLN